MCVCCVICWRSLCWKIPIKSPFDLRNIFWFTFYSGRKNRKSKFLLGNLQLPPRQMRKIRKLLTLPKKSPFSVGNVWDSAKFGAMCLYLNTYTLEMFQEWIVQDLRLCYTRVGGEVLDERVEISGIRDADHMRTIFKRLQAFCSKLRSAKVRKSGSKPKRFASGRMPENLRGRRFIGPTFQPAVHCPWQISNPTRPHRVAGPQWAG